MGNKIASPAGNIYDKFNTKNPIARILVSKYKKSLHELTMQSRVDNMLEVGCGEGYLVEIMARTTSASISAIDLDLNILYDARDRCQRAYFSVADARYLPYCSNCFDLVCFVVNRTTLEQLRDSMETTLNRPEFRIRLCQ